MDGRPGNFPPTYDEAIKPGTTFATPPIGSAVVANSRPPLAPMGAPPQPVVIQQVPPVGVQTVIVQPGGPQAVYVTQPNVVLVHPIKIAPCFNPYTETCPHCNVSVVTQRRFVPGGMTCVFLILGIFFLPFLCFLCCDAFKDAHHYCPRCHRLIAVRKR